MKKNTSNEISKQVPSLQPLPKDPILLQKDPILQRLTRLIINPSMPTASISSMQNEYLQTYQRYDLFESLLANPETFHEFFFTGNVRDHTFFNKLTTELDIELFKNKASRTAELENEPSTRQADKPLKHKALINKTLGDLIQILTKQKAEALSFSRTLGKLQVKPDTNLSSEKQEILALELKKIETLEKIIQSLAHLETQALDKEKTEALQREEEQALKNPKAQPLENQKTDVLANVQAQALKQKIRNLEPQTIITLEDLITTLDRLESEGLENPKEQALKQQKAQSLEAQKIQTLANFIKEITATRTLESLETETLANFIKGKENTRIIENFEGETLEDYEIKMIAKLVPILSSLDIHIFKKSNLAPKEQRLTVEGQIRGLEEKKMEVLSHLIQILRQQTIQARAQKQYDEILLNSIDIPVSANDLKKDFNANQEDLSWKDKVDQTARKIGQFSNYNVLGFNRVHTIPKREIPSAQYLSQIGADLSILNGLSPITSDPETAEIENALVKGTWIKPPTNHSQTQGEFRVRPLPSTLLQDLSKRTFKIPRDRIMELLESSQITVNDDLYSSDFSTVLTDIKTLEAIKAQSRDPEKDPTNTGLAICISQKIEILVDPIKHNEHAVFMPRNGTAEAGKDAVLLLSTPALNCSYGSGKALSDAQKKYFITEMYRLIFHVTRTRGYEFIALPPAGLGVFQGNPVIYFEVLLSVAAEFPELKIIYNPAANAKLFGEMLSEQQKKLSDEPRRQRAELETRLDTIESKCKTLLLNQTDLEKLAYDKKLLTRAFNLLKEKEGESVLKLNNIMTTHTDVLCLADQLTRDGFPCALHNPSDADAVFCKMDIGQYWKYTFLDNQDRNKCVGEEVIGKLTTAPWNYTFNPNVKIDYCGFKRKLHQPIAMQDAKGNNEAISVREFKDDRNEGLIIKGRNKDNQFTYIFIDNSGKAKPVIKILGDFIVDHDGDFLKHMEHKIVATQLYAFRNQILEAVGLPSFKEEPPHSVSPDLMQKCKEYLHIIETEHEEKVKKINLKNAFGKITDWNGNELNIKDQKITAARVLITYLENFDPKTALGLLKKNYNHPRVMDGRFGSIIAKLEAAAKSMNPESMPFHKAAQENKPLLSRVALFREKKGKTLILPPNDELDNAGNQHKLKP